MSKRRDEEILLEMFLRFILQDEGITYEVMGEDVPNRTADRNFDYLLRSQSDGSTMALEITLVSDNEDEFGQRRLKELVLNCIDENIRTNLSDLPTAILIETPYLFQGQTKMLKREAELVGTKILNDAKAMLPSQVFNIESPIGLFKIHLLEEGTKGLAFSSFGQPSWTNHFSDVQKMFSMLQRRLSSKNIQLDTDAHRRVILIGRMAGIIDRDAISEALAGLRGGFSNIEELYICYGDDDIKRYW